MNDWLRSLWPLLWFIILYVSVFAYSLGDGFDLGVSTLYFLGKDDKDRRTLLNSIGPVWDGNEVWLIVIIGGLFAGFPKAYGLILSIFYMPIWILLSMYILRAISLEFRSKIEKPFWKLFWDISFCFSGTMISFFLGALIGNLILGVPLGSVMSFSDISWKLFLRMYPALCGGVVVTAYTLHGTCYLLMKTEGALQERIKKFFYKVLSGFYVMGLVTSAYTVNLLFMKTDVSYLTYPLAILLGLCICLCTVVLRKYVYKMKVGKAFVCSSLNLLFLVILSGVMIFPNLLRSNTDPSQSVTIYNAAASDFTLKVLLMIVAIGLPLIIVYFIHLYRVFRGKTNFPSVY